MSGIDPYPFLAFLIQIGISTPAFQSAVLKIFTMRSLTYP
ncbi:hypothetical protein FDUTEX481_01489 [Tolypothrix sp. PCC 7601]|nr:hypothetical protein FDUTEX481_01489 [Tolypothrix sp. PCC 7601]